MNSHQHRATIPSPEPFKMKSIVEGIIGEDAVNVSAISFLCNRITKDAQELESLQQSSERLAADNRIIYVQRIKSEYKDLGDQVARL